MKKVWEKKFPLQVWPIWNSDSNFRTLCYSWMISHFPWRMDAAIEMASEENLRIVRQYLDASYGNSQNPQGSCARWNTFHILPTWRRTHPSFFCRLAEEDIYTRGRRIAGISCRDHVVITRDVCICVYVLRQDKAHLNSFVPLDMCMWTIYAHTWTYIKRLILKAHYMHISSLIKHARSRHRHYARQSTYICIIQHDCIIPACIWTCIAHDASFLLQLVRVWGMPSFHWCASDWTGSKAHEGALTRVWNPLWRKYFSHSAASLLSSVT